MGKLKEGRGDGFIVGEVVGRWVGKLVGKLVGDLVLGLSRQDTEATFT
jgi:hypothetical protein